MKTLNQYIKEKLIINKDYRGAKIYTNKIVVKSFDELRKIIEYRYDKLGAGTKHNPIDFNDIDVSNLDSFNDKNKVGIFENTKFKYIDISEWAVSNVTNMSHMFYVCKELKSVGDLSDWDVSNVTNMSSMFLACVELESIGDISKWDVSNVTNMSYMFYMCRSLNQDLSDWDVSKVQYNILMFHNCQIKEEYKPKFK